MRQRRATVAIVAALSVGVAAPSCSRRATVDLTPAAPTNVEAIAVEPVATAVASAPARPIDRCEGEPAPLPSPRAYAACDPSRGVERLSIVHVSDMHAHFHGYLRDRRSPFATLRAFAARRRAETGARVLFLDAGDDLEKGSLADVRSRGDATVHLLDHLDLDARTLGNHDFAWGLDSVVRQSSSTVHRTLASNVSGLPAKRTTVFEIGCVRVGVFGLVINPYDETDERVDAPYLGTLAHEHDPADTDRYVGVATRLVRELRDREKVDVVIAVNHLGAARDRVLVDSVPGLDLVVSAHDHQAIAGHLRGRFGVVVGSGTFLGAPSDARVGEATLEIDLATRAPRLVDAASTRLEDLRDHDASVQKEVERIERCFAPDAHQPIAELAAPLGPYAVDTWTRALDAAIRARFPGADAILYEAWARNGIVRGELPRGPLTPQQLADFAFSERQTAGRPGFTAFVPVTVSGRALRDVCGAPLREAGDQRMHRICPEAIDDAKSYTLVIERRSLHAPHFALSYVPKTFPKPPSDQSGAVEAMDLFIEYARARGKACLAFDRDSKAGCY